MSTYYGTAVAAQAYYDSRGMELPLGTDTEDIESALLVASEYLDGKYASSWIGSGTFKTGGREQIREWPRAGYVDVNGYAIGSDVVPREVEQATYEAAYRQLKAAGSLSTDFKASASYKRVSIDGAISVDFNGSGTAQDAQITIPIIGFILAPLIYRSGAVSQLTGGSFRV